MAKSNATKATKATKATGSTRTKRQMSSDGEAAVPVTIRAEGTVTQILGIVPFTMSVPVGAVFFELQIMLSLMVPALQSFPPGTVRFYLNGVWTGLIDRGAFLRAGDQVVLAAEAAPRFEPSLKS